MDIKEEEGTKVIHFKPKLPLIANYEYMIYIEGEQAIPQQKDTKIEFKNEIWSFKTISISPIRIVIVEQTSQKAKLVTLERTGHDLYLELRCKTAVRFEVPPHQCQNFTIQNNDIKNNYDVSLLKENDKIEFKLDPNAPFSNLYIHEDVEQLSFEEYKKQHWVNEEAGFYALVGKMTKEEENDALLQMYL